MRETAERTATLEQEVRTRQQAENDARSLASLTAAVGLALTRGTELRPCSSSAPRRWCSISTADSPASGRSNESGTVLELQASAGTDTQLDRAAGRVPVGRLTIGTIAAERARRCDRAATSTAVWRCRLGPARRDGGLRRLSPAGRLEAGRRDGDVRPPRVLAVGAGRDGRGRRRHGARHRAQAGRARAGALHAGSRGGARHRAAERRAAGQTGRSAARDPAAGRSRDPRQERFPRQHEPRAAHAAERHHSLQRAAAGGSGKTRASSSRSPTCSGSSRPASTCSS